MAKFNLIVEFSNRVISIPFKSISSLDNFTVNYDSYKELGDTLSKLLNFSKNINDIYIQNIVSDRKIIRLPIKYSMDDFDVDDVKTVYKQYYKDNHQRIKTTKDGIKNVKHDTILDFIYNVCDITDMDIDKAVDSYFKGSYKKYRDAYFTVKRYGYKVKNRVYSDQEKIDLSKYSSEDEYFQSLMRAASLGKEDEATEELSLQDMNDIKKDFKDLFDGVKSEDKKINESYEWLSLQALSGMSAKELEDLINSYRDNGRGRR